MAIKSSYHPKLKTVVEENCKIEEELKELCLEKYKSDPEFKDDLDKSDNELTEIAVNKLSFYKCYECWSLFYAGLATCEAEELEFDPQSILCKTCKVEKQAGKTKCDLHGVDYIEYKCQFWCSLAIFAWRGGTIHFCGPCHTKGYAKSVKETVKCDGDGKCKLGVKHLPNGKEYALGCGLCRNSNMVEAT